MKERRFFFLGGGGGGEVGRAGGAVGMEGWCSMIVLSVFLFNLHKK